MKGHLEYGTPSSYFVRCGDHIPPPAADSRIRLRCLLLDFLASDNLAQDINESPPYFVTRRSWESTELSHMHYIPMWHHDSIPTICSRYSLDDINGIHLLCFRLHSTKVLRKSRTTYTLRIVAHALDDDAEVLSVMEGGYTVDLSTSFVLEWEVEREKRSGVTDEESRLSWCEIAALMRVVGNAAFGEDGIPLPGKIQEQNLRQLPILKSSLFTSVRY